MMNADLLLRPGSLTPSLLGLALALLLPFAAQAGSGALRVISDENYPPYLFLNAESTPGVGSIFWLRVPL